MSEYKIHALVCSGTGCRASESDMVVENLKTEIAKQGLSDFAQRNNFV